MTDSNQSRKTPLPKRPDRIRPAVDAWCPLVDMMDIMPGNRGTSRDGELELFDAPLGIRFEVEAAVKSAPLIEAVMPWEENSVSPLSVWKDGEGYHMLYDAGVGQCYAFSEDAYTWTRPNMNEVEYEGSRENNLLGNPCKGATGTFEDPSAAAAERFKAVGGNMAWFDPETSEEVEGEEAGRRVKAEKEEGSAYSGPRAVIHGHMLGWTSADQLHWKRIDEPLAKRPVNGGLSARYDEHHGTYFAYLQLMGYPAEGFDGIGVHRVEEGMQVRTIGFSRTTDFGTWPAPKLIHHPDAQDDADISFYGANYFAYPGRDDLHGMMVPIFHHIADTIDGQIAFSRDGLYWSRPERRAILPLGAEGEGDECIAHFWRSGIVELPDGYWACPYTGSSVLHCTPDAPDNPLFPAKRPRQIRWARWRPHRFCGIRAVDEGRFTMPTLFRSHDELRLNYRCEPGGWIQIELLNKLNLMLPDSDPAAGFSFEACDRLTGDGEDQVVTWKGKSDISAVGKSVAIRVRMFGAKLFAYRV